MIFTLIVFAPVVARSGAFAKCTRRGSARIVGLASEGSFRSLISTDVSIRAGDRCCRLAVVAAHVADRFVATDARDTVPAVLLSLVAKFM